MSENRKISGIEFDYMLRIKPYEAPDRKAFKHRLLASIEHVFGDRWSNLSYRTREAIEYLCFLSVERGFFYASPEHIAEKSGISKSTIYEALKLMRESGIIYKTNRCSRKQNGLGCAVHFFIEHPYFYQYCQYLGLDWKADRKAENAEMPCHSREDGVESCPTLSLPNNQDQKSDIQSTVPQSAVTVKYVPKEINDIYAHLFGYRLRNVWVKITQAFKTLKQTTFGRSDLLTIGANIVKRVLVVWKQHMHNGRNMTLDAMCALAYKSARETFFNTLGDLHNDYREERNISDARRNVTLELPELHKATEEAIAYIPVVEKVYMEKINPLGSYVEMKQHVIDCIRWEYRYLDEHSLNSVIGNYDLYTKYGKLEAWIA